MRAMNKMVLAAALLVAACNTPLPPSAPTTEPTASAAAPPPSETPITGLLSEESFKALHELRPDRAPPARGTMIDIASSRAYLSLPKGAKPPMPAVVVIHEWWGLNEHIKHWTDRLAEDGYAALAVDLYGGQVLTNADGAMKAVKAIDEAKVIAILKNAHRFVTTDPRVRASRTGSIGWCFGGGFSLKLALNEPELDAAVVYYGSLVTDAAKLKAIRAPLVGVFGNKDKGIPPESVDSFDKALTEAGVAHEIYRYDAEHAFANPSNPRYDTKAAADAWEHVRSFFAKKLKGT